MVAIVDYGMGNLKSVANAIDLLGFEFEIIRSGDKIKQYDHVILPGVGSYSICMDNLKKNQFDEAITEYVKTGRPFMGICLGMQILSTMGFEGGETNGLNMIEGKVQKFTFENADLKVPHVGWNNVTFKQPSHNLLKGLKGSSTFYFTHSYYFEVGNSEHSFATAEYGKDFTCAVLKDNMFATQFHPEKSQEPGLKLLFNFLNWNP